MPITATFKTSEGTIVAKLFDKEAPETVKNLATMVPSEVLKVAVMGIGSP